MWNLGTPDGLNTATRSERNLFPSTVIINRRINQLRSESNLKACARRAFVLNLGRVLRAGRLIPL